MRARGQVVLKYLEFVSRLLHLPFTYPLKVKATSLLNRLPRHWLNSYIKDQEILDLGCGSFVYHYDPKLTSSRIGIDAAESAIFFSKFLYPQSHHLLYKRLDQLPFADNSFDYVTLLFVIHHLPAEVGPLILKEANRVARKGILIGDHVLHDTTWKATLQNWYWRIFDGGLKYRKTSEWLSLLESHSILEARRFGSLFQNLCFYSIKTFDKCPDNLKNPKTNDAHVRIMSAPLSASP